MTLFWATERATLLIKSGSESDPDRKHLFIILCNPVTSNKLVLLASLSSIKQDQYHDPACIIHPSETEHSFIRAPSFVVYKRLELKTEQELRKGVDVEGMIPLKTIERKIVERIVQGVLISIHSPKKCKDFVREFLLCD
jgi:hypothetical protein